MIVIPRKKDESIIIGDDIIVTVIEIRHDKVRLGIEHPPEVPVHRLEVYEAIRRSRQTVDHPAVAPLHFRRRFAILATVEIVLGEGATPC